MLQKNNIERAFTRSLTAFLLLMVCLMSSACQSTVKNRDPIGEKFPSVTATALSGETHQWPQELAGEPALLLVGYVQRTQFDLDRWLYALMKAKLDVKLYEVPTIKGLMPRLASGWIDSGMRGGIPEEDWSSVACVYAGAEKIVALTGNEGPQSGRIILLDSNGIIRYCHQRGFSASAMLALEEALANLRQAKTRPSP